MSYKVNTILFFVFLSLISISLGSRIQSQSLLQTSTSKTNLKLTTQTKLHSTSQSQIQAKTEARRYNSSAGAFGCLILGLILFPVSICCIFWNERMAVKDTEFTDMLEKPQVREYTAETIGTEAIQDNQLHMYTGTINVFENAKVYGIDFETHVYRQNQLVHPSQSIPPPSQQDPNQTQVTGNNQQLGYSQTLNNNDEKAKLVDQPQSAPQSVPQNPPSEATPLGAVETKIIAYDFILEDFVRKDEVQDNSGGIEIQNIWTTTVSNLFKENEGVYPGIFNFDNKVRLKDQSLLRALKLERGKTISFNDELRTQLQNYIQAYDVYRHHNVYYFNDEVFLCQNSLGENKIFTPTSFPFLPGDIKIKVSYIKCTNYEPVTVVGNLSWNQPEQIWELSAHETDLKEAGFCCLVTCQDSDTRYKHHYMKFIRHTKKSLVDEFHEVNFVKRWVFRVSGWFLHFLSIYLILYPVIFVLNYIPIIGALTAFVLVFAACLCSMGTCLGLLVIAWIVARPVFGVLLIFATIGLIIGGTMIAKGNPNNQQNQNNTQAQNNTNISRRRRGG